MEANEILLNIARNINEMVNDIERLEERKEEQRYQRLVSKSIKHMALVAKVGDRMPEAPCFEMTGTEAAPQFSSKGDCTEIRFPTILKKSRRLAKTADLKLLYEKYEKPIRDHFWDKQAEYGKRYVFWFEFRGWSGDNDNLETKIIIDLISGYYAPDDTGKYISLYKTCEEGDEPETILRIMPEEEFAKVLEKRVCQ